MIGAVAIFCWLGLFLFWGRFWACDQRLGDAPGPVDWPGVATIIPARNEAETIGAVARAHGDSDYPGERSVIVIDDNSTDDTASVARNAGVDVLNGVALPNGWSGKIWALEQGIEAALERQPLARWYLLTDADILHDTATLRRLVAFGESNELSMVSLMARLDSRGLWGAMLIPAFVFFFQKLYPFPWVNRDSHWCAAAAGGCVLIRRDALEAIGGISAIRGALIDDCSLAARIKRAGYRIWLGLSDREVRSLRDNREFGSIWKMVSRTAFTQLRHSVVLLILSFLGMALLYLAPPIFWTVGILSGTSSLILTGSVAWILMSVCYLPTVRYHRLSSWRTLLLPIAAALYLAMTIGSAIQHWRGRGGMWKGRTYS